MIALTTSPPLPYATVQFVGEMSEKSVGGPGPAADGRLPMTREEAHQLDVYAVGQLLRYMLTGVPPGQTILQVSTGTG